MKRLFSSWRMPEFLTSTARGLNGGRTGVDTTVKHPCIKSLLLLLVMLMSVNVWGESLTGKITFGSGSGNVAISSTSVKGNDSQGNEWTITNTTNGGSYTQQSTFSQVGSSSKACTSLSFSMSLPSGSTVTAFNAKFGGSGNGAAGKFTMKIGGETIKTSNKWSGAEDQEVKSGTISKQGDLSITFSELAKGVKCYYIEVTYTTASISVTSLDLYIAGNHTDYKSGKNVGDKYTLPDEKDVTAECGDKTFVGWSTGEVNSPTEPTSNFYAPGAEVTLAADNIFYAVFADASTESEPSWVKITDVNDVTNGTYAIISYDGSYYLSNAIVTSSAPSVTSGTKESGVISVLDNMKWNLTNNNGTLNLQSVANNDAYLWGSSTNEGVRIGASSAKANATKDWNMVSTTDYGLVLNNNSESGKKRYLSTYGTQDWRNYNSTSTTNCAANLYKLDGGTTYSNYTTTCAAVYEATVADGITNGSVVISKTDDVAAGTASLTGLFAGDKVYIFPTGATGYKVASVSVNGNPVTAQEGKYIYTVVDADMAISATFALIPYTITYEKDGGEWTGAAGVDSYTYGTGATLPIADDITKANNTFLGWYVTNPAEIVTSIGATETGDKSFTASWQPSEARAVAYSGGDQLNYISNPQIVDKDAPSLIVTYSVNKGYTISAVTVTVDGNELTGEGEVEFNDEQLTIAPNGGFTGDVVITFTIVEKKFTVTWMANKAQFKQEQIQEGSKVTLPAGTPEDVISGEDTYKFQGWITDEQYSSETIAPAYIANNTIEPTGDVTYYAVYATKESGVVANSYVKGAKTDLTEGQKVIIVNGDSKKALSSEDFSNDQTNYRKAIGVTITNNNKISNTNANIVWTVSLENSKYIFKQGTNYLNSTGNNLFCNGNKDTWTITAVSGNAGYTLLSTGGSEYLEYYSKYTEFTCYTGGSGNAFNMDFYIPETTETTKNYRTRVAVIDYIAVNGTPVETKFVAGETFDATGLTIDVYYQGEDVPTNVTEGFTFDPTGALTTENNKIKFSYQGKTDDVNISVSNTVSGIEVTTKPTKMEYTEGEQFNPEGMVVTATYNNGAERDVTGYTYTPTGDLALGDEIEISFGGQKTNLEITINEATKTTVNWFVEGNAYTAGNPSTAVIPGKKVTVLPTEPEACQGNQFVGWTTQETYYNATTAPTDLFKTLAAAPTIGETETNFYAVFASEAVGTYDEKVTLTSLTVPTADKFTYAFANPSGTQPAWVSGEARAYANNTLTVTSKNSRVITKIEYTYNINSGKSGPPTGATVTGNNSDNGSWDPTNKTWTSSTNAATAVTLTVNGSSGNYGFTAIKVYLTGGTVLSDYSTTCLAALAVPTITNAEGTYCGSVDVEITQSAGNPEGAKIMYSTDNTNWNEYENAVKLEASGTVYAKVVKEPKQTEVVSATYTVYPAYTLAQAAAAATATSQTACLTFTDLLVQARSQNEAFLKASDGQIVLLNKSSHGLSVGDKLIANDAHVTFVKAHDLLQLTSTEGIAAATTGNATTPEEKTITALVAADYGQLVKIMNVTYDATNKKFTDASSNEIAIDTKFFVGGSLPPSWPDGGKFNATGIALTNGDNVVIAPRNSEDLESLATPLDKPTNFAVASVNSYRASYSWTTVDNNVGYTLYIYDGATEIYKSNKIGSTIETYAPTKDLEAGHTYTAKLVALGDKAEHSDSPAAEVEFTTNPNAKLNWYRGGNLYQTTFASQEKVVTPETDPTSPCATNYENFVTWYTEEIVSETGQITALEASKKVKAGDAAASQAGSAKEYNFYAVFGKVKTPGTDKYVAVTSEPTKWEGEYLIVHNDSVFNGSLTSLDVAKNGVVLTREEDGSYLASNANNYRFVIAKSTTKDEDDETAVYYTIQSASEYFIGGKNNDNGMNSNQKFATQTYDNILSWSEDKVEISSYYGNTYLTFNTASNQLRFRYMKSTSYNKNLVLYKREKTNPQYSGYITTCPVTYTITIAENAKGLVEAAKTTEILEGAKVLLTANANAGYTKTGGNWIVKNTTTGDVVDGLVGGTNYLTMPDYDVTIDYNFQEIKDQFVDNLHGNEAIEKGGAGYELPTLSDFSETTGKPSDAFKKFIGWSATSYDSGEPATEQPTILEGSQTATGATYFAVWHNQSGKYITEYCQTAVPTNLHLVEEYHKATSVRIDWNNVDGADKYHIIVMDGETNIIADADVTESLYDLSGLTPGATYIYTVKAHKNCWSDETEDFEFTTKENIQSYAVTINAEGGTYTIDPTLDEGKIQEGEIVTISDIAVTDATIHYFKELTVPEATDLKKEGDNYTFTMPGKPVTINIVFAEFPKVTWKMAGQADIVTSSVLDGDKFVIGADNMQPAPATWTFKEYYKEFAGWMTNNDVENPVFATASTEVPADGLTVNGAVAKSASADMSDATKVTSNANLDMKAHYVIGGEKNSTSYFFSDYASADTQLSWGLVTTDVTTAAPLVFTLSGTADELAIQDNRGNYLVEPSKNKTITMSSTKGTVSLDATGNIVSGTSYYFRVNTNSGSEGVRWYDSKTCDQAYLYKVAMVYDNLTTDPSGTQIRPDAKVGMISGICYERDIVAHSGATFYYLSQKAPDESYIELTEVTGVLHAGYPYLFEANANEIEVIFDGDAIEGDAYDYNGLYGTFIDQPLGDGYCIILNNKYYRTHDGNNNGCYNHRAYLKLSEVSYEAVTIAPGETEEPATAPRRIRLGGDGVNTPTGFDGILNVNDELIQKLIINDKMYIFRAGKMYDAAGALVK